MRVTLFDWTPGGHHLTYLRRFAEALDGHAEVTAAVPDVLAGPLGDGGVQVLRLGEARPAVDPDRPLASQHAELARAELDRFAEAAAVTGADRIVHLYADPVIRRLVERPPLPVDTVLYLHFPRAHFRRAYGTPLGAREQARAWFLEYLVARWRRRPDARALLTLDEEAVHRWNRRPGVPAFWVPEPPVTVPGGLAPAHPEPAATRSGCALYGALAPRKGLDLLARAVALGPTDLHVTIAGTVEPGFGDDLQGHVAAMRATGARVDLRSHTHSESEGLQVLAGARCAVLPYPQYREMSRVLLEACAVGTPVVVNDYGMLGHLVRRHGLGVAVDCTDPRALRDALERFCAEGAVEAHRDALAAFAEQYAAPRFGRAVLTGLQVHEPASVGG